MSAAVVQSHPSLLARDLDETLSALCSAALVSMPRSDQRAKGELYARGLLLTEGRKSMRNIAVQLGAEAAGQSVAGQSMHHFISCSTWDWRPVRQALARRLDSELASQAWVLRAMQVPKTGEHSVGVERRFDPDSGRIVNSQQAYGLWASSGRGGSPVNWGLHLPEGWLADQARRSRAKIPDRWSETTPGECALRTVLEVVQEWGLRRRPVVLELGEEETAAVVTGCVAAGVPFLARIDESALLVAADPALSARGRRELRAQQLLSLPALRSARRPVRWWDPVRQAPQASVVTTVEVERRFPAKLRASERIVRAQGLRPLTLLGDWSDGRSWPCACWLTNLTVSPVALLRLTRLAERTEADFAAVGEQVGLRDFEGRSFEGWHRHTTLASVAHAARILVSASAEEALEQSA